MQIEKHALAPQKPAWLAAAWIFVLSRLVFLFLTVLATRFPLLGQATTRNCPLNNTSCLLSWWSHYDVLAYAGIAERGYSTLPETVFFPLWPLLLHWMG